MDTKGRNNRTIRAGRVRSDPLSSVCCNFSLSRQCCCCCCCSIKAVEVAMSPRRFDHHGEKEGSCSGGSKVHPTVLRKGVSGQKYLKGM